MKNWLPDPFGDVCLTFKEHSSKTVDDVKFKDGVPQLNCAFEDSGAGKDEKSVVYRERCYTTQNKR